MNTLEWLAIYSSLRWRILPLHAPINGRCSCGRSGCGPKAKHPLFGDWQAKASANLQDLQTQFAGRQHVNVGCATGASSGFMAIDVDPRHGGDQSLASLETRHGSLPSTVEAITGGGGRHLLFLQPPFRVKNSVGRLGPGIDVRGDGGFIVVAPSIHVTGGLYRWREGHDPLNRALAECPRWLLSGLRDDADHGRGGRSSNDWRAVVRLPAREGQRNATIARMTGHLLRRGIDPWVAAELILSWNRDRCRPPLSDDEVLLVVDSIARAEHVRRGGRRQ